MSTIANLTTRLKFGSFNWLYLVMILLTLAGLGVSGYLMWGYTVPGAILACGASQGCETVKNSSYANLMGIPIPVVGLVSYGGLLLLLIAQNQASIRANDLMPYVALAIFGLSFIGVLYSAYLTYIELFVIYAICRWCVTSAILMTALFLLSIFNLRNNNQLSPAER
jgi:uncharacterized membrane protein